MKPSGHISTIVHDMGRIFEFLGIVCLVPLIVLALFGEWEMLVPIASAPAVFLAFGFAISCLPHQDLPPSFSATLAAVAISWFAISLVGSLPFILGLHMTNTDALFEAMSGWTGTGLSMLNSPDSVPRSLLFFRSFTQWVGGIGIIVFGISLQSQTRVSLSRLYRAEGREEELVPASAATSRRIWMIYLVLTFGFTGMIMLIGISLWDAINLVMVAIATGGFGIHDGGLMYYNNPLLEFLLIPVMIAGAIPFKIYFLLYHGKVSKIFANRILAIFLTIALAGAVAASASLLFSGKYDLAEAIRFGAFSAVSGLCTCGLGNNFLHVWPVLSLSILILLTVIGGTMGSTAGGIKVNRVVLAYEGVKWWFRRFFVSSRVVVPFRSYKRNLSNRISDLAIAQNMLVIVVYVLTVFVATILIFHLYITSFRVEEVVFEIVSALSNSGLTTGFISEASPVTVKWVFIFLMWLGRLEIVPVVLILMGAVRAFQDSGSGGSNSQLN